MLWRLFQIAVVVGFMVILQLDAAERGVPYEAGPAFLGGIFLAFLFTLNIVSAQNFYRWLLGRWRARHSAGPAEIGQPEGQHQGAVGTLP